MKKLNKAKLLEGDMVDYQDHIFIYHDKDMYFFDSKNKNLLHFSTSDYLVAVAALMKMKDIYNFDKLWSLKITDTMKFNINVKNALYWISGGDREWLQNNMYNNTWDNCSELFIKNFENILYKINEEVITLGDCRDAIIKYLALHNIYEFALSKKLLN